MKFIKKWIPLVAVIFLINSCSGAQLFSGAQYEFDQGLALFNTGKYEEAIPRFQKAVEIDPEYARAYLYLGRSYLTLTRWNKAIPPLRTALRISPGETKREALNLLIDALFGVAVAEFKSGDFKSAVDNFGEMLQLKPNSSKAKSGIVDALLAYGRKALFNGNLRDSIASYTEALKYSPNNLNATLGLAKAFLANGEFQKSMQAASDAMRVDPTNRDVQSLIRDLQRR